MAHKPHGLAGAAVAVTGLTAVQKVVGFLTELAVAGAFGATALTDAYLVGFTLPHIASGVALTGVSMALIPAITAAAGTGGTRAAVRLARRAALWVGTLGLAAALLGIWAMPWLVAPLTATWQPSLQSLAVAAGRLAFPAVALAALAAVLRALLNSHQIFLYTPWGVILQNLAVAVPALVLAAHGPLVLSAGYLAGVALHLVVYFLAWRGAEKRAAAALAESHTAAASHSPEPGEQLPVAGSPETPPRPERLLPRRLLLPLLVWSLLGQAPVLVERLFAGLVPAGAVSAWSYGYKLRMFPIETAVQAVATVMYPTLAAAAALDRRADLARTTEQGLRLGLLPSLPAAVGLYLLAEPIVRLVYERGAFGNAATAMTAAALAGYAPGVPAHAVAVVLAYAAFAAGRAWLPVLALTSGALVQGLAATLLIPALGARALPWASTIAAFWAAVVLAAGVRWLGLAVLSWRQVLQVPLLATAPVWLISWLARPLLDLPLSGLGLAAGVLGVILAAVVAFLVALVALRVPELELVRHRMAGRFWLPPAGPGRRGSK